MLFHLRVSLAKPAGMSNREFYGIWKQESEAGLAGMRAGIIKSAYKVPGKPEVIAVLEVPDADTLEHAVLGLPIWKLGYSHMVSSIEWTPLRPYEAWAEDLKTLAEQD